MYRTYGSHLVNVWYGKERKQETESLLKHSYFTSTCAKKMFTLSNVPLINERLKLNISLTS